MLMVGVQGCGKSRVAKAVAAAWQLPLLRLDLGALKSKWVGESEGNVRKALRVAETVAPVVLWADEIEKALAGATQGAADGGVSADALSSLLTWMQDRAGSVFLIATSNDVSALPPELLRKGRFDEIFFVDLPTYQERIAILKTALIEHKRADLAIDLARIAWATKDFSGAEIAALVPDALFTAFADNARDITTLDLEQAAARTVPLAHMAREKITALRAWGAERARAASLPETNVQTTGA
jgi:SpoVK/Ycf46/Vps4 family AAA+-type ATPase